MYIYSTNLNGKKQHVIYTTLKYHHNIFRILVFKFIDEDGVYRIIPKGISNASNDYIDPWYDVQQYNVEN